MKASLCSKIYSFCPKMYMTTVIAAWKFSKLEELRNQSLKICRLINTPFSLSILKRLHHLIRPHFHAKVADGNRITKSCLMTHKETQATVNVLKTCNNFKVIQKLMLNTSKWRIATYCSHSTMTLSDLSVLAVKVFHAYYIKRRY